MTDAEKKPREFWMLAEKLSFNSPFSSNPIDHACMTVIYRIPICIDDPKQAIHVIEFSAFQEAQDKIKNLETFILESDKYALDLEEQVAKLEARVEKLREALKYYANRCNWVGSGKYDTARISKNDISEVRSQTSITVLEPEDYYLCGGKRARVALKEDEEQTK